NRPINVNPVNSEALVTNFNRALDYSTRVRQALISAGQAGAAAQIPIPSSPLTVATCPALLPTIPGVNPTGNFVPAALVSFFRKSGTNPSLAPAFPECAGALNGALQEFSMGLGVPVPFSDMDANYSNGSSVYHGLTANLRKRFSNHYEFLASYTWSHTIDDSTDLQSPLAPQDSYFPSAERSTSLFDQRHRFVFSGVYQSGKLSGDNFASKFFSHWTVAPIVEIASGRPFNIITGNPDNFQFSPSTGRPNVVPAGPPDVGCGPAVASKFSPSGFFQEPCFAVFAALGSTPTLQALDGNFARNAAVKPWTVFSDLRVARRISLGERINLDL